MLSNNVLREQADFYQFAKSRSTQGLRGNAVTSWAAVRVVEIDPSKSGKEREGNLQIGSPGSE